MPIAWYCADRLCPMPLWRHQRLVGGSIVKRRPQISLVGRGIDRKFLLALAPNETKVLHVDLKPGQYKAYCLMTDHANKKIAVKLTAR